MRVAVGAMMHETNTFTARHTFLTDFSVVVGNDVFQSRDWVEETSAGGILRKLLDERVEVVPTLFARALPSGTVDACAYRCVKEGILTGIRGAKGLDGVCLALHGSMFAEGVDDPEGDLLAAVRGEVGQRVPVVCALDMHATITPAMVEHCNGMVGYRTAPHTDVYQTGQRAAELLLLSLREHRLLQTHWVPLPMLLAGEQSETSVGPMKDLVALLGELERRGEVLSASYFLGFPWADSPHHNVSAVTVAEASSGSRGADSARVLARALWQRRHEFAFTTEAHPLEEAVEIALREPRGPVIIADSGDNPTAGASEDLSLGLKSLLDKRATSALVAVIVDSGAVARCDLAAEGALLDLTLGRLEPRAGAAGLAVKAALVRKGVARGIRYAVLRIEGVTVVVTAERTAVTDPGLLEEMGLTPGQFKVIMVKSGYLSPEYAVLASRKMLALTPGDTNEILAELPYSKVRRPIFPLDMDARWP